MSILREQRKERIVEILHEGGSLSVDELGTRLSVSDATVRRDLEELAEVGKIIRIRGGAALPDRSKSEPPVIYRSSVQANEKQQIGRRAAELISDGETVFLGSGSTVLEVARSLTHKKDITIITNSLPIVDLLSAAEGLQVIATGGLLRFSELSFIGHLVERSLSELRADKVIISIQGIHLDHGLTNEYMPETMSDRAILAFAHDTILVADHTKFGKVKSSFVADISSIGTLVTDSAAPRDFLENLAQRGTRVIIAD